MGESATDPIRADVLVVGAGPSGLMLGLCLARLGVDAIVIDPKPGPTRESRALAVQVRSQELYDQLGLTDRVAAESVPMPELVAGFRDRVFGRVPLVRMGQGLSRFDGPIAFEQSKDERMLADALAEAGRPVRWGWRLESLRVETGVVASVSTPDGPVAVRARYCVGADGSHSRVREAMGVAFEGTTNPHTFFVTDAHEVTGLVDDAINLRWSEDDFLLAFPMGAGAPRHRLVGIVRDRDLAADGTLPEELARERLAREFGVRWGASGWFDTYRVHHRLASRFRVGPCFLVGDAAHVHSPVGAQGMNTGLQEAHDLACALADVLVGGMPDTRLDRYEAERRPVGERLVESTDRVFAAVTADDGWARTVRSRVIPAVGPVAARAVPRLFGPRAFGYLSQLRIRYPLPDGATSPVLGRRLPYVELDGGGGRRAANHDVLRAFTWQVHGYGVPERVVRRVGGELGVEWHAFPADPRPRRTRTLRRDRLYLVRRDGFVVAEIPAPAVGADLAQARVRLAGR